MDFLALVFALFAAHSQLLICLRSDCVEILLTQLIDGQTQRVIFLFSTLSYYYLLTWRCHYVAMCHLHLLRYYCKSHMSGTNHHSIINPVLSFDFCRNLSECHKSVKISEENFWGKIKYIN